MTTTVELIEQEEIQSLEDSQRDLYLTFHLHNEDYAITNVSDMPNRLDQSQVMALIIAISEG